jgi:hypothetical protein
VPCLDHAKKKNSKFPHQIEQQQQLDLQVQCQLFNRKYEVIVESFSDSVLLEFPTGFF